jgi:hypothetical protein
MTDESYERFLELVEEARDIRYVLFCDGAMVTKSVVEDVLMARHNDVDRALGHDVMNHIEFYAIDRFPRRRRFEGRPTPTLSDFPEIAEVEIKYPRCAQRSKA